MKLSQKKKDALYIAIHERIMDIRLELNHSHFDKFRTSKDYESADDMLFKAVDLIWNDLKKELKLQ